MRRLTQDEFIGMFDTFEHSAFRLETLPQYLVDSETERLRRYKAGEPFHLEDSTREWLEFMRREIDGGKRWHKVHVLASPLSEYLRFECEWGYATSTQYGQEVGILDTTEIEKPAEVLDHDFWIFDDKRVVLLRYDEEGHFLHADEAPTEDLPKYQAAREAALSVAVPFAEYWAAHPEFHSNRS